MSAIRVIIVDDEEPARLRMRAFLEEMPDVKIVRECADGEAAVKAVREESPDLLFLDLQMPRMGGFEVVRELGGERLPVVVFVTAYDQFALRAFEVHALDYLLKPFSRERLMLAVERARARISRSLDEQIDRRLRELIKSIYGGAKYLSRVEVKLRGRAVLLPVEEIDWIGAANNYVELHAAGREYLVREKLSRMCEQLDPAKFRRVHRSTAVNLARVVETKALFNGDHALHLRDGTRLVLSRSYSEAFFAALGKR